jgi:periplasmic protein TonB
MYTPTLIESKRRSEKRFLGLGLVSFTIHAAVIAGAAYSTLGASGHDDVVLVDTSLVFFDAPRPQSAPHVEHPVQLVQSVNAFQTLAVPALAPTIPGVDLQEHFDVKDFSARGVEGGEASSSASESVAAADQVFSEGAVEEPPKVLSAPPPPYPEMLRDAGIQGRVVLEVILDTAGHAEPSSIKILRSPSPGFDGPVTRWALKALFRPARLRGRAVRVLIQIPIDYSAAPSSRGD